MTEIQDKPTLVFDGKNYTMDDLSDTSKYIVSQLQDLENQINMAKGRLDQLEVAKRGFTNMLGEELRKTDEEKQEEIPGEVPQETSEEVTAH